MKEILKGISNIAVGAVSIVLFMLIPVFFIKGGLWLSEKIFPLIPITFFITLALTILIFLPIALIKKTRAIGSSLLYLTSYVYGLLAWVWSFLITYATWGGFAVLIGFLVLGIGVVPMALFITITNAYLETFIMILVMIVLTFATRVFSSYLLDKLEE